MAQSEPMVTDRRARRETWWLAAVALLMFTVLRQEALHGTDWRWLVLWLDEPDAVHAQHPGYLPLARVLRWMLMPLQLDAHALLCVYSALGGALAVAGIHRAALALCFDSDAARCTAALAMFTPALFHFATVCELHAPFAAVMAWALWSAVRWAKQPTGRWAVSTAVLTGAATLMHATGQLLVPLVLCAVVTAHRKIAARPFRQWALFATVHLLVWGSVYWLIRMTGHLPGSVIGLAAGPQPDNPAGYFLASVGGASFVAQLPPTALTEWLLPYAPASLLCLGALANRNLRAATGLLLAVLAVYLAATVVMVHAVTDERGGYLLPLLLPAVLLMQAAMPRRIWPLLLAVTIVCGILFRGEPGRLPPDRAFGRAAVAMSKQHKTVFFVADFPEMDGAFLADAKLDLLVALAKYDELRAAGWSDPTQEEIAAWLHLQVAEQRQKGAWLVITDRGVQWLTERLPAFGAAWPAFAQQAPAVRLPADAGIAGFVVR